MRSVLLALLLGGCLIVRTTEETTEENPCPFVPPALLADARGPFAIAGDTIYFIAANETLSRIAVAGGGPVSELTTNAVRATKMAVDATDLYWAADNAIMRRPLGGGAASAIVEGTSEVTELAVDDASVVWASTSGLDRWSKADQQVTHLYSAGLILGLGVYQGVYYVSDTQGNQLVRTPPTTPIAQAYFPASLVVDEAGVYFFEASDASAGFAGQLRLVPRGGGSVVTTADGLNPIMDLTSDETSLYFIATGGSSYRIKQVSRFGGELRTLACGKADDSPVSIANHGSYVYWADGRGLYRVAKDTD